MAFTLPPEPSDRIVTITIPAALDGYFKQWYLATRKQDESPEEFAFRNLAKAGLAYREQVLRDAKVVEANAELDGFKQDMGVVELDNGLA